MTSAAYGVLVVKKNGRRISEREVGNWCNIRSRRASRREVPEKMESPVKNGSGPSGMVLRERQSRQPERKPAPETPAGSANDMVLTITGIHLDMYISLWYMTIYMLT